MAFVSAFTLIRLVAAFHLAVGYLLVAFPQRLANVDFVFILGEALGLQQPRDSFHHNPLGSAVAGFVLILSAISDLTALGAGEEIARDYWGAQGPIRCAFFGGLAGYVYAFRPAIGSTNEKTGEPIFNSLVFSWTFFEAIWWFWIYTNLREERNEARTRIALRKKQKAELAGEDL